MRILCLTSLLVLFVAPSTEAYPARSKEEFDPRFMPVVTDPVPATVNIPIPAFKPDPLENIGVELSKGYLIEGDIRIWHGAPPPDSSRKDTTTNQESLSKPLTNSLQIRNSAAEQIWLEKIIPYEIDPLFNSTEKQTILNAMDEIMSGVNRCIQFIPREQHKDFLYIDSRNLDCSSDIGKKGGNQSVSISRASECVSKGIIMHELLHALGLWHEHTRTDRDNYIEIIYHNVRAGHDHDFDKNSNTKLLTPYDYYSIMHYKINQFSKFARLYNTIRILQPGVDETKVGQREYLSDKDKEKITILYQCKRALRTSFNASHTNLLSGLLAKGPKSSDQNSAFGDVELSPSNNVKVNGLTPSVLNNKVSDLERVVTPVKPTVRTNIEVVSESVMNLSSRKQDTPIKMNETETAEIGKK